MEGCTVLPLLLHLVISSHATPLVKRTPIPTVEDLRPSLQPILDAPKTDDHHHRFNAFDCRHPVQSRAFSLDSLCKIQDPTPTQSAPETTYILQQATYRSRKAWRCSKSLSKFTSICRFNSDISLQRKIRNIIFISGKDTFKDRLQPNTSRKDFLL